jgi:hypothetical protein
MCRVFQQKFIEKNERLARKCYQLFKEQAMVNYDDVNKKSFVFTENKKKEFSFQKFQEQIRTFFANSNDNINQLLHEEIPNRLVTYSRQCYMNVATCLQKRAYDTSNEMALDMHKQLVRILRAHEMCEIKH